MKALLEAQKTKNDSVGNIETLARETKNSVEVLESRSINSQNVEKGIKQLDETNKDGFKKLNNNVVKLFENIDKYQKTITKNVFDENKVKDIIGKSQERREFKTVGSVLSGFKDEVKDFFSVRGFLDKTGIVKRGTGGLISDTLDRREEKQKYIKSRLETDPYKNLVGKDKASEVFARQFDEQQRIQREIAKNEKSIAEYRKQGFSDQAIKRTGAFKTQEELAKQLSDVDTRVRPEKEAEVKGNIIPLNLKGDKNVSKAEQKEVLTEQNALVSKQNDLLTLIEINTRKTPEDKKKKEKKEEPQESQGRGLLGTLRDALDLLGDIGRGRRGSPRVPPPTGGGGGRTPPSTPEVPKPGTPPTGGRTGTPLPEVPKPNVPSTPEVPKPGTPPASPGTPPKPGTPPASPVPEVPKPGGPIPAPGNPPPGNGAPTTPKPAMGASVAAGVLAAGEAIYSGYQGYQSVEKEYQAGNISLADATVQQGEAIGEAAGGAIGGWVGAAKGAAAGAAIGSVVPVIGTAAGAVIGSAVGALGGSYLGKTVGNYLGNLGGRVRNYFRGPSDTTQNKVETNPQQEEKQSQQVSIQFSEMKFAENDRENYEKFRKYREELQEKYYTERINKLGGEEKVSGMRKENTRRIAATLANRDAVIKFKDEIEKAGAGTVKITQSPGSNPTQTQAQQQQSQTPPQQPQTQPEEVSRGVSVERVSTYNAAKFREADPENFSKMQKRKREIEAELMNQRKLEYDNASSMRKNAIAERIRAEASNRAIDEFSNEIKAAGAGTTTTSVRTTPRVAPPTSADSVQRDSAEVSGLRDQANRPTAPTIIAPSSTVNSSNNNMLNNPNRTARKGDDTIDDYLGRRYAF